MTQALAERAARITSNISRRKFLNRAVVAGTALSVAPIKYLTRPGDAWASHPGHCSSSSRCNSGYTEFCCSVEGVNDCPYWTYVGGYWKCTSYQGSSYCHTVDVRYYIDCNVRSGYTCGCLCTNGSCNCRWNCCTNFNYGNCNSSLAYRQDKVRCRKIMCHNPAADYSVCSYSIRVDDNTCWHESCTHCL